LAPKNGKKTTSQSAVDNAVSFSPEEDPDRLLTYLKGSGDANANEILYGKGLEERFKLAREPLRACRGCFQKLAPLQEDLRASNSNAMRFNHVDPTDARRLFNSPLAHTLGHEIRKAAYTLNNLLPQPKRMGAIVSPHNHNNNSWQQAGVATPELQQCKESCSALSPNLSDIDGVKVPARLLEKAKGIAFLTVVKGGFGLAGVEFGTGLVVARLAENRWSAPSAIGTAGISWGALLGAQVSDHVFFLMTDHAVQILFSDEGSVQLGADVGVAVGPLGRSLEGNLGAAVGNVAPIYTYSMSKGFYAGISLDGKVIVTRNGVNEKFYGRTVSGREILAGAVPLPPAAQPLYEALARCHVYTTGDAPGGRSSLGTIGEQQQEDYEYGEFTPSNDLVPTQVLPGQPDQHSVTSDITSDLGY
jgi:lipid-binding SYLF domain-containing protein